MSTAPFAGDTAVASYATQLAKCHAARTAPDEATKRHQGAVDKARKDADAWAKLDKQKAIDDAVAAVPANADKKQHNTAVARAKREAAAAADADAKKKKTDAVATVPPADVAAVTTDLEHTYQEHLATDFAATMQAMFGEYGPGWQKAMKNALTSSRKKKLAELTAKPKVKKGETAPPARAAEEIDADLEAFMSAARCEQNVWAQNRIEGFKHGWMVGRREEIDFETIPQTGLREIARDFKAPRDVPAGEIVEIPEELRTDKVMPGVAPEVAGFLRELQKLEPDYKVGNYAGHGSWGFAGKGFSVDLYIEGKKGGPRDDRGFWEHQAAVDFLLNLDKAATAAGAEWRVLYNDFSVAEEVNRITGVRHVVFTGNVDTGGHVNWHGPDPMKLHFHLDIAPPVQVPAGTP